ncbi:MAG: large subunit ribosomal protein [Miltoncostaeaceae bacterium]|jgi:large subunit ribosomal protein L35|nr:large subunit ribosomal protein [Miltoncostaeaceae bacterium]
MPKMKTSRAAKKRFRVTPTGKVLYLRAGLRHNLGKKSSKRRHALGEVATLAKPATGEALRLLGRR